MEDHLGVRVDDALGRRLDDVVPTLKGLGCMQRLLDGLAETDAWQAPNEMAACLGRADGSVPRAVWIRRWAGHDDEVLVLTLEPQHVVSSEGLGLIRAVAADLRVPLVGLRMHAGLLQSGGLTEARLDECIATVQATSELIEQHLASFGEMAELAGGQAQVERSVFDPRRLLRDRFEADEALAHGKSALMALDLELSTPAQVESDLARVEQVLGAMVEAATDASAGGRVHVVSRGTRAEWTVIVGGIAAREMVQLDGWFEPGSGRGPHLAVARRWAGRLGGSLGIEKELDGRGALRLTLPTHGGIEKPRTAPATAAPTAEARAAARARVLVADAGTDQRKLTSSMLRQAGWDVVPVGDGQQVLEELERAQRRQLAFDVIVMDLEMPEMDGFETVRRLRSQGCELPVIATTGSPMMGDKKRAFDAGCDGFFPKPLDRKSLVGSLERLARRDPVS